MLCFFKCIAFKCFPINKDWELFDWINGVFKTMLSNPPRLYFSLPFLPALSDLSIWAQPAWSHYENKTVSFKELNPIIETSKMFTKLSKCNILPPVLNKLIWRSVLHCRSGRHVMLELANSAHEAKEWDRRLVLLSSEGQSELESYYHNLHHLFKWISSLKICDRYFSWFFFWPLYSHHLRHYLAIYCFLVLDLNLFVLFHLLLITHFNVFSQYILH